MLDIVWSLRARSVAKARKAFLRGEAEGLHDLRVALRRTEATAAALGKKKLVKRVGRLVRSLSDLRQLEVDRLLLARLRETGRLPENVASALDARWSSDYSQGLERAARLAGDRRMRRTEKRLRRLARRPGTGSVELLEKERDGLEESLAPPPEDASDRRMHRFRIAVKRARYLAEDLAASGVPGLENRIEREKDLQDALGRWNDLRLFRGRLQAIRAEAEESGSVTLAGELDPVIAALEGTLSSARREAFAAANRFARVLPFLERSA